MPLEIDKDEHMAVSQSYDKQSGARFSKAPESFRARKAIFRSSAKNGEGYTPETSCMKGTSLHL